MRPDPGTWFFEWCERGRIRDANCGGCAIDCQIVIPANSSLVENL